MNRTLAVLSSFALLLLAPRASHAQAAPWNADASPTVTLPPQAVYAPATIAVAVPTVTRTHRRANRPMIGVGVAIAGAGWLAAIGQWLVLDAHSCALDTGGGFLFPSVSVSCSPPSYWMLVPVVGPWLAYTDPTTAQRAGVGPALEGVAEVGGLAVAIAGAVVRHRDTDTRPASHANDGTRVANWSLAPMTGRATGLSLTAHF